MNLDLASLAVALSMAVAAGLVGCFAVMRRMTLAADALSHVALPGIGLALLLNVDPLLGAVAMLLVGALLIWGVERRTRLSVETVVGVTFAAALAAGSLVTPGEELIDALFGGAKPPAPAEAFAGVAVALGVIGFVVFARDRLVVALVSPDIARTTGIPVEKLELAFLVAFSLTVALGLHYLGVLLMGSLIIIPAAIAKRLAHSLRGMFTVSVGVAVLTMLAGALIVSLSAARGWLGASAAHPWPTGPVVVLIAASVFFASLGWRRA